MAPIMTPPGMNLTTIPRNLLDITHTTNVEDGAKVDKWECKVFEPDYIEVFIDFDKPLLVSQDTQKDTILIKLNSNMFAMPDPDSNAKAHQRTDSES